VGEAMSDEMELPLSVRVLAAAETMDELNRRYGHSELWGWNPKYLRRTAQIIEAEDRETREREALIEELALEMYRGVWPNEKLPGDSKLMPRYRNSAQRLIEILGWRKGDSS
jgi:hypothetical protein